MKKFYTEKRNEKVLHMTPCQGWWKSMPDDETGEDFIRPVAFFAIIEWEERRMERWEKGKGYEDIPISSWERSTQSIAVAGGGDEWSWAFMWFDGEYESNTRLFYDPDFRLTRKQQSAHDMWMKEEMAENEEIRKEIELCVNNTTSSAAS